jgi:hypothetical protein
MNNKKEIGILLLGIISELTMAFQVLKPNYFFCSSMVIVGTSYTIARAIILVNMLGMAIFIASVYRGNIQGRLHVSYGIMLCYAVLMIVLSIAPKQYMSAVNNSKIEMNSLVYLVTMILEILIFTLFILREKGAISIIPKMSSLMLLVILGQFVTNGLFIYEGAIVSHPAYLIFGLMSALPYITIFLFEFFILEPTMLRYR